MKPRDQFLTNNKKKEQQIVKQGKWRDPKRGKEKPAETGEPGTTFWKQATNEAKETPLTCDSKSLGFFGKPLTLTRLSWWAQAVWNCLSWHEVRHRMKGNCSATLAQDNEGLYASFGYTKPGSWSLFKDLAFSPSVTQFQDLLESLALWWEILQIK